MQFYDVENRFRGVGDYKYSLIECITSPDCLEEIDLKNDRKANFLKVASKMTATFLKRAGIASSM